eukprot:1065048-Prorocentrum_minimum.AAC.3
MVSPISGVGSKMRASFVSLTVFVVVLAYFVLPSDAETIPHHFKSIRDAQGQDIKGNINHEEHLEQLNEYARRQKAAVLYFKRWNIWNEETDAWFDEGFDDEGPVHHGRKRKQPSEEAMQEKYSLRAADATDSLGMVNNVAVKNVVMESAGIKGRTSRFADKHIGPMPTQVEAAAELNQVRELMTYVAFYWRHISRVRDQCDLCTPVE